MRRRQWMVGAAVLGVVSALASVTGAPDLAVQAYERVALSVRVGNGERQWRHLGSDHYRIVVRRMDATWHIQWNTVVVTDGEVTEHSARCAPAPAGPNPCQVRAFDPAEYTVPGLFSTARSLLGREEPDAIALRFDETYGYPRAMSSDRPDVIDDVQGWAVESFTPL